MPAKYLFLTLKVFSETGGIEKVSRIAGKALSELCFAENNILQIYCLHDKSDEVNDKYFSQKIFKGFNASRSRFIYQSIKAGLKSNVVFVSHINLLPVAYLIKKLSPKTKIILLAHGIEVWGPLEWWKKIMLKNCDKILAVSHFTKTIIDTKCNTGSGQCIILNNCLDPFLEEDKSKGKPPFLLKKYELKNDDIILLTLARISSIEKYKGHEKVIQSVKELQAEFPSLKYIIAGRYDDEEKKELDKVIRENGLTDEVIFTGFVADEELAAHFKLADIYVMPSKKEGFGITFIEAMFYGVPVIAGNKDGSPDAVCGGALGLLVNPESQHEITEAIKTIAQNKKAFIPDHNLLMNKFSYQAYKNNLSGILKNIDNG